MEGRHSRPGRRGLGAVTAIGLALVLGTSPGTAMAARYESWAFKATLSESARYSLDYTESCYSPDFVRDAPRAVGAQFRSTAVYERTFVNTANPLVNVGNANGPDRHTAGQWTYSSVCGNHSGTVGDVDSLGGPSMISTALWAKVGRTSVRLRAPAAYHVGAVGRLQWQWFDLGGSATCCSFDPPPGGGGSATDGLVATADVARRDLTALSSGTLDHIDIALRGPSAPWTPAPCSRSPGCRQSLSWSGKLSLEPICIANVPTGKGYAQLNRAMKAALKRLYREVEKQHGCYRFTVGYRAQREQDRLRKRWHDIADRSGSGDRRTDAQICTALKGAGFAQCPAGHARDGTARGGPAAVSRHTSGSAADVTIRWPRSFRQNLGLYQQAARRAGLCGPPSSDPVHVESPYSKRKGKRRQPVRCHFPEGPAP